MRGTATEQRCAKGVEGHIAKGDAFSLNITTNTDHPGVSILYLNPPYDTDSIKSYSTATAAAATTYSLPESV